MYMPIYLKPIVQKFGKLLFDTSNVTDMSFMFMECHGVSNLDVSKFDTSNVTNMKFMFNDCRGLTNIDLSNFDTSNVTDMSCMFRDCSSAKEG